MSAALCPKCQRPLPDDAPQGLCPACLLGAALPATADVSPAATIGLPTAGNRSRLADDPLFRRLRTAGGDRPRRHGRRLQGPANQPEPDRRPEDDPGGPARFRGRGAALPPGSGSGRQPRSSQHRADPRSRRVPGHAVLQHEADRRRRPEAGRLATTDRRSGPGQRPPGDQGRAGRPSRPPARHPAPRPQAGQHPPGRQRRAAGDRLRPGPQGRRRGRDAYGRHRRHARLHGPGAGGGPERAVGGGGHVQPGSDPLRAADRPAAVRRRQPDRRGAASAGQGAGRAAHAEQAD